MQTLLGVSAIQQPFSVAANSVLLATDSNSYPAVMVGGYGRWCGRNC